jgi:hypothetical protein
MTEFGVTIRHPSTLQGATVGSVVLHVSGSGLYRGPDFDEVEREWDCPNCFLQIAGTCSRRTIGRTKMQLAVVRQIDTVSLTDEGGWPNCMISLAEPGIELSVYCSSGRNKQGDSIRVNHDLGSDASRESRVALMNTLINSVI